MKVMTPSHIVGIGASAGGLQPIEEFFDHMGNDSGMAFVIVQHLSPGFKSKMDELLARHTRMEIHKVSDGVEIRANCIYLIPPEKNIAVSDGKLLLTDKAKKPSLHFPIDTFFRSLAKEAGEKSIAIILSGTGSDGSRGIKDVREANGLVFVQTPESAGFDGMPRVAIASGVVDLICEAHNMPDRLLGYLRDSDRNALQQTEFSTGKPGPQESALQRLYRIFSHRNNIDFSLYKTGTISRRLERRMRMSAVSSLEMYIDKVEEDDKEADMLFRDLLVEVTHFFRDPEAFVRLRESIIPALIQQHEPGVELRAWVSGCATGEEAYSIAMLLHDGLERAGRSADGFKVFATDVHSKSLEIASNGFYPSQSLDNVTVEFQNKYFVRNNGICNVKRELRQSVLFAQNDLTHDPPFTRLDLISCRNVLIYLEPSVQKRILSMFHFGLKKKGVLFLGPSETIGDLANEFEQLDRHWRIYSKRRNVRLKAVRRMPLTPALGAVIHGQAQPLVGKGPQTQNQMLLTTAFEDLLAKHVPPSLLVDEYNELVHCFGNARKLLTLPEGKPSNDILKMLDRNMSISVSAALHRAKIEDKVVVHKGVRAIAADNMQRLFTITVEPYKKKNQSLFLISLEEAQSVVAEDQIVDDFQIASRSGERIAQLEGELSYARETLQATVEELESSNEELQATNEEMIASNEELQSTNEELHSVNEELCTVNSEHKAKIEELTQLTSDMDNLLKSTKVGAIFLDKNLNIRMFTPSIKVGFNVLERDVGRPINDISCKLDSPELSTDTADVLKTGVLKELEVKGKDGRVYLQRIQPYRADGRIEGVALTLTDITEIREAENARATMRTHGEVRQELPHFEFADTHDLQAILRHINHYANLVRNAIEGKDEQTVKKTTDVLRDSSEKLRQMIDGLLAYSRIDPLGKRSKSKSKFGD